MNIIDDLSDYPREVQAVIYSIIQWGESIYEFKRDGNAENVSYRFMLTKYLPTLIEFNLYDPAVQLVYDLESPRLDITAAAKFVDTYCLTGVWKWSLLNK